MEGVPQLIWAEQDRDKAIVEPRTPILRHAEFGTSYVSVTASRCQTNAILPDLGHRVMRQKKWNCILYTTLRLAVHGGLLAIEGCVRSCWWWIAASALCRPEGADYEAGSITRRRLRLLVVGKKSCIASGDVVFQCFLDTVARHMCLEKLTNVKACAAFGGRCSSSRCLETRTPVAVEALGSWPLKSGHSQQGV